MRANAIIYGRDPRKKITYYQEQVNSAAIKLALSDPGLLESHKTLLERARNRVVEGGYNFIKGKSRSKQSNDPPKLKFEKSTECMRKQNIAALEEDITDLKDRLQFKEKRRHQSEMARNYKVHACTCTCTCM